MMLRIAILISFVLKLALCQENCQLQGRCGNEFGYHIATILTADYFDCQTQCQSISEQCSVFTFETVSNLCELLANCTQVDSGACTDCVTSERDCAICSQTGQCSGSMIDEFRSDTEEECQDSCANNNACGWYSFSSDLRYCLLTSNCNPVMLSGYVYGQRECSNATNLSKYSIINKKLFIIYYYN